MVLEEWARQVMTQCLLQKSGWLLWASEFTSGFSLFQALSQLKYHSTRALSAVCKPKPHALHCKKDALEVFLHPVDSTVPSCMSNHRLGGSLLLPDSSSTVRLVVSTMSCALLCIFRTIFLAVCTNLAENAGKSWAPSPRPCEPGQYFGGPLHLQGRPQYHHCLESRGTLTLFQSGQ